MRRSVILTRVLSSLVAINGALVLLGWVTQNEWLIKFLPGFAPMVINTAVCFILIGIATYSLTFRQFIFNRTFAIVSLLLVSVLAGLTLCEYLLNINLGIDFKLPPDTMGSPNPYAGRMSVLTSLNFFISSLSLLALTFNKPDKKWLGQYAILLSMLIALLGLTSNIIGAKHYYSHITTMALHTTVGFLVLGVAYFGLQSSEGIVALLFSKSLGGKLTRRILIPLLVLYPILSLIRLWGEKAGFYNAAGGTAFMMVTGLGLFIIITFTAAQTVARLDREKEQYKKFFELSSEMLLISDSDGLLWLASNSFSKNLGYTAGEVMNRNYLSFIHEADLEAVRTRFHRLASGETINAFPLRLITKTGATKHFLWSVTSEAETGNLFIAGYDVTEIKEAEQVRALAEKLSVQNKQLASFAHNCFAQLTVTSGLP